MSDYRRQAILCDERVRTALREGIKATQLTHPFTIDAWVLLPDHLHTIWTLPPDDADFGIPWALIKRFVTKQCNPELKYVGWISAAHPLNSIIPNDGCAALIHPTCLLHS